MDIGMVLISVGFAFGAMLSFVIMFSWHFYQIDKLLQRMARLEVEKQELELKQLDLFVDAQRYRFMRDVENWGENNGEFENLIEANRSDFDEIVDGQMHSQFMKGYQLSFEPGVEHVRASP